MSEPATGDSKLPGTPAKPNFTYNLNSYLGIKTLEHRAEVVIGELEVRPELMQPWGFLHGGVLVSLADTLCGMGCAANLDLSKEFFLTVELKTNFTRAVREGIIRGEAHPITLGRQIQLWECRITDEAGKLLAYFTATQLIQKLPLSA